MSEFFQMGGYASYIWSAYGISALVLTGLIIVSLRAYRRSSALVSSLEEGRGVYAASEPAGTPANDASKAAASPEAAPEKAPATPE